MSRPTLSAINLCASALVNQLIHCPTTKNKGDAGLLLERLTGIPTSSALLDAIDGEVKIFPVKTLRNGTRVPKETVAVTMLNPAALTTTCFEDSHCAAKLRRVLFVPYMREGDHIKLLQPALFTAETHAELFSVLAADYAAIQNELLTKGELHGETGVMMQSRTKGAGGTAKKTRAFYLRPAFMKAVTSLNP
jgi:DNA mismatch repair protein MutH